MESNPYNLAVSRLFNWTGNHACIYIYIYKANEYWLHSINSNKINGSLFIDFKQADWLLTSHALSRGGVGGPDPSSPKVSAVCIFWHHPQFPHVPVHKILNRHLILLIVRVYLKSLCIIGWVILVFSFPLLSLQLEDNVYHLINVFPHWLILNVVFHKALF